MPVAFGSKSTAFLCLTGYLFSANAMPFFRLLAMNRCFLLFFVFMLLMPSGCQKIELPSEDSDPEQPVTPPLPEDSADVSDVQSVEWALACSPEQDIVVKGYIVGYVNGTAMSAAVFGIPEEKANTNMLLADSKEETDPGKCLPVRLDKGTSSAVGMREELNLYDHPEYFRRLVVIEGWLSTYFRRNGIRDIYGYAWAEEWDEEDIPPSGGDESGGDETPGIDQHPGGAIDGR